MLITARFQFIVNVNFRNNIIENYFVLKTNYNKRIPQKVILSK